MQDTAGAPTPISGCSYPDAWNAAGVSVPTAACAPAAAELVRKHEVTPAPKI